jgi:hypothetical protein
LVAALLPAEERVAKPACNETTLGSFWPDEANRDRKLATRLTRCGELEICLYGTWRYHWGPLTVHVNQLARQKTNAKPAECEVPVPQTKPAS